MAQPYHALQQLLDKIEADVSPATVHGLWCGRVAAGDQLKDSLWWQYTLHVAGLDASVDAQLQTAFQAVADFAEANLQQENFSFEPWLPADSTDCSLRVAALADWCRGFIEGLTSVMGRGLLDETAEAKEIIQDLLEIGEVDPEVEGSEEDERQLLELSEFVKVAALNLYHEIRGGRAPGESVTPDTSPTLH